MTDMHLAYGTADGNARRVVRLYQERYRNDQLPDHLFVSNLHRRLSETERFRVNRRNAGRP